MRAPSASLFVFVACQSGPMDLYSKSVISLVRDLHEEVSCYCEILLVTARLQWTSAKRITWLVQLIFDDLAHATASLILERCSYTYIYTPFLNFSTNSIGLSFSSQLSHHLDRYANIKVDPKELNQTCRPLEAQVWTVIAVTGHVIPL